MPECDLALMRIHRDTSATGEMRGRRGLNGTEQSSASAMGPTPQSRPRRSRVKSQSFINGESRWQIRPAAGCAKESTYVKDYIVGQAYAIEFLKSCDGSMGGGSLLVRILGDLVWTDQFLRNMDGDVVCRGTRIFAASPR
jgi:hypothetical protein